MQGLIADIGATNARFALAGKDGAMRPAILKCTDFPDFSTAAQAYLSRHADGKQIDLASVAIAGPVTGDRIAMTNHPWAFSIEETRQRLGLARLHVMNDFEAVALAVPHLAEPDALRRIGGDCAKPQAPIGIIGPGTGLGVAALTWDGARYRPVAGEGGHVTIPVKTQRELDVAQWLLRHKYSHISAERVCSGKGLVNLYNALRGLAGDESESLMTPEDISARALDQSCPFCVEALSLMTEFLGSVAGNLALTLGAFGGIYIAGGIIPKLGGGFDAAHFHEAFLAKGRFRDYLSPIPCFVVLDEFPAFTGLCADLAYR